MSISIEKVVWLLFYVLGAIIFCNLNGVSGMILGTTALFSPILLVASLLGISLIITRVEKKYISSNLLNLFFLLLGSYLIISTISVLIDSSAIHRSTNHAVLYRSYISTFLIVYVFYLITVFLIKQNQLDTLLRTVTIFLFLATFLSAFSSELGITSNYNEKIAKKILGGRTGGLFANPNEAGVQATFTLAFCLFSFYNRKNKILSLVGIMISIYAAFISFSKGAIIMAIIIIFVTAMLGLFYLRKHSLLNKLSILSFGSIVIFLTISAPAYFFTVIFPTLEQTQQRRVLLVADLLSGNINEASTSNRTDLAEHGGNLVSKRPLLGNGLGSFHRLKSTGLGVHNAYFMILGEAGIFPFVLMIVFVMWYILAMFWFPDKPMSILLFLLSIIIAIQVFFPTHNALEDRTFNGILGISLGINRLKNYVWN